MCEFRVVLQIMSELTAIAGLANLALIKVETWPKV